MKLLKVCFDFTHFQDIPYTKYRQFFLKSVKTESPTMSGNTYDNFLQIRSRTTKIQKIPREYPTKFGKMDFAPPE